MQKLQDLELIQDEQEISLFDILRFSKGAYKTIFIASLSGLIFSVAYIYMTPKRYEAGAPIYASIVPISPPKGVALAAGLFLGLFIVLARHMITKIMSNAVRRCDVGQRSIWSSGSGISGRMCPNV